MIRAPHRSWLAPVLSVPLIPLLAALTGCPGATTSYAPSSYVPSTGATGASPTPTPPAEERSVSGTLYDDETGMPLVGAVVYLGGRLAKFTGADGTFTATYSAAVATPSLTLAKSGYANLTVHGHAGGPLALLRPVASDAASMATRSIAVTAPGGSASKVLVSVAVKRGGYAHARSEAFKAVDLSAAGTGSVDVALPDGQATVLAYGFDGNLAGSSQGPVGDLLSVELTPTADFGACLPAVPAFKTDSVTTVGYYLTWPSDSPVVENRVELAILSGSLLSLGWALPPVESFGIPGASYMLMADAATSNGNRLQARHEIRNVNPGVHALTWLPEASWLNYRPGSREPEVTFLVYPQEPVPGANALVLDMFDTTTKQQTWRVVAHQASSASVEVPNIFPYGLKSGTQYGVRLNAAINPDRLDLPEKAVTYGTLYGATYDKPSSTATYRLSTGAPEADAPASGEAALEPLLLAPTPGTLERPFARTEAERVIRALREAKR